MEKKTTQVSGVLMRRLRLVNIVTEASGRIRAWGKILISVYKNYNMKKFLHERRIWTTY